MSSGDGTAQEDPDIWTDFEFDEGPCGTTSVDGKPVWGAHCPQPDCDHLQLFEGQPENFASRPYSCSKCGWVSLMHSSVADYEVVEA